MSQFKAADEHLISRVAAADDAAYQILYERYWSKVVFFLKRVFPFHMEQAEDLGQDVFSDLYQQAHRFDGRTSFASYLFGIARKKGLNALRQQKTRSTYTDVSVETMDMAGSVKPTPTMQEQKELSDCIADTFARLPEEWRTVLYLRERNEFSYKEIASTMQVPITSVETWIHRGRKRFIEIFSRDHGEFLHELF